MNDLSLQAAVVVNSEQAETAFDRVGDKAQQMANEVSTSATKAGQAVDKIGDGADKGAEKFTRAEARMRDSIKRSTRELEMLGKTASQKFEANLEFKGLDKAKFQPFLSELRKAEEATKRAETGINSMSATAQIAGRAMALAFSGAAITGFLGKVVSVQREFDVLNSSLKTVTGSSAAAEREMAWLKDFAKETPFGLAQATQGFVKMKALGLDPTRAALTSFGNTASAMGKDLNQMIEAVADASTGEFERLKEFGIKAKKEGDNVSLTFQGVTTTIRNSAADITKYLENIGNVSFGGAMEERAKTLDGTIAALGDTWDELFRTVSTNNVGGLIFDSVTLANGALEDATTILRALGGAAQDAGRDTGALSTIQSGIATVFETVAVLGANLKFVLVGIGNEIGGLAAQVAQAAQFNFSGVAAIRRAMVADAEAARKEIDATTARILNARKAQEEYARYATRNASAATDPRRVDLGGSALRATGGVSSGTAKAVKETISEYDKLIKKLSDELPKAAAEAEAAQMGYNKAQTEFLALAGSPAWASFSNSQRAVVASMFEGKIASEQAGDAAKELSKAYAEAAAERLKTIQSMERAADSLQSQNDALREEIELIGLSTEQQTLVLQQRNDVIILTKEATLAELERQSAITGTQTRVEIALASEIEALKERNALLGAKGVKNAAVDAAKSAADEWQKTSDKINDTLTDALMRGFESGKDFAKNLRDTVINMFNTMVLRPVISVIVNPVAGAVTGMMGLSGAANASTGGGASMIGNAGSLIGAGSSAFGIGASYGATSLFANGLGATLSAGSSMIGAGSTMSGLGTIAGALGPIALGLGALFTLVKKFDDSGTYHTGGAAQYSAATGLRTSLGFRDNEEGLPSYNPNDNIDNQFGTGFGYVERGDQTISAVSGIAQALGTMLDGVAVAFGEKAGYAVATAFADDTSKDGAWGALRISKDGADLLNWNDTRESKWAPREFADGEEGYKEYLAEIAKDTRSVLLDMDLPSWADTMLESIGDTPSMDQLAATVQQIGVIQATFVDLGKAMEGFASLTDKAFEALMKAAGGIESLAANAGVYYENFYSASEKTAVVKSGVSADLAAVGIDMPKTRKEYRELVDAQLALGESGAKAVAVLLELSGAFASFTPTIEQLAESAGISASQISTTIRDGLLGRISGEEVGASIGKMVTDGIYNAIAGSFADQITQIFMTGIVNPVIQAAITGSSISALVSQASIVVMVEQANAAMKALSAIFEDPEFLAALARINDAVGNLSKSPLKPGQSGGASGYTAPAWEEAIDLDGLIGAVRGSWNDLISEIVNDTKTAADELKKLTDFGKSSYELDMEAIQSRAQARTKEYWTPEREQAVYDVVNVKRQQQYQYDNSAGYYASMGPEWAEMAEWARKSADELGAEITALLATIGSAPPEITALIAAEQELLRVRNTLKAADMTGDLRTEIDRLGMSDLERALAGISDRADDYVKSLQDLGQATDANIGAVGEWEDAMRLDAIKKAWAGVTDSILGEIDRIRGNLSGDSGLAALQAEFAINTAKARAGDTEAAGTLAGLSRDILRLSEGSAGSAFDWARMQAQMLASLEESARIAALYGGGMATMPVNPSDYPHMTTGGEFQRPPVMPYVPPTQQNANAELIAEIKLLNRRLETLEANTQATALHTQKTSKALERAMPNGDAIATREIA